MEKIKYNNFELIIGKEEYRSYVYEEDENKSITYTIINPPKELQCHSCGRYSTEEVLYYDTNFWFHSNKIEPTVMCSHCKHYYHKDYVGKREDNDREKAIKDKKLLDDVLLNIKESPNFKLNFGKYKDIEFKNIPLSYLNWIITQDWIKKGTKIKIEYYLKYINKKN
jgi:uncharacterized protein (DUF3820 family)